jgi:HPt (histidine-containing phosphotransfer) domain-containing protein
VEARTQNSLCYRDFPRQLHITAVLPLIDKWLSGGGQDVAVEPVHAQQSAAAMDYGAALSAFMGDRAALTRALGAFLKRVRERLSGMAEASARGDLEAVAFEAHAIKGGALSLHAEELAQAAFWLEKAARGGSADAGPALLEDLRRAFAGLEGFVAARGEAAPSV